MPLSSQLDRPLVRGDVARPGKPFSHTEAVSIAKHIEGLEREKAEERRKATLKQGDALPRSENYTDRDKGQSRDKIAAAVGMSHPTLSKARTVVEHGTPELQRAMDKKDVSVHTAAKLAKLPPVG